MAGTVVHGVIAATDALKGVVELATNAEALTGRYRTCSYTG